MRFVFGYNRNNSISLLYLAPNAMNTRINRRRTPVVMIHQHTKEPLRRFCLLLLLSVLHVLVLASLSQVHNPFTSAFSSSSLSLSALSLLPNQERLITTNSNTNTARVRILSSLPSESILLLRLSASSSDATETDDFEWKDAWDSNTNNDDDDNNIWATFEPSPEDEDDDDDTSSSTMDETAGDDNNTTTTVELQDDSELWLDTLAALSAEEMEFNAKENDRADKVRQMQEWGFDDETVKNTFGVEVDDTKETKNEVQGMKEYRQQSVYDWEEYDEDLTLVESHTKVAVDEDTKEPIRQQMVYVDEHACIGCTNCAMVAQSTFFMEEEHGRARVFQQWGDDDETVAIAIETCPVDCIHYIPYQELVALEIDRRSQSINFKARLVNQGEAAHMAYAGGGQGGYTAPQQISGNFGSRCNNCPTRGCKNCPMFGVGKNPEFEKKEQVRKAKLEKKKLLTKRKEQNKSIDL